MQNKASEILTRLESFTESKDVFFVSLEALSRDESCKTYYDICDYMQLSELDSKIMVTHLKSESLWYIRKISGQIPKHATSGVSNRTIARLQGAALTKYTELFGDLHVKLGYQ